MAYYDLVWYCNAGDQSTTGYYAVAKWAATTAIAAGALRRQLAVPTVNSERVFVCIVAGTTGSTEPTWVLTRGAKTTDGTVTWMECTGIAALNGDITNTVNWTAAKAIGTPSLGTVIKRNNGASYQICTTAGTLGAAEPAFSDTAGVTTADSTSTWTSLGVVGNWTAKGAAPHARLGNACASPWFAVGNTVFVGDNHAESQTTGITISPLSSLGLGKIICHNHSGNYPPAATDLATTATISMPFTGVAGFTFSPNFSNTGWFYVYGLTFTVGTGSLAATFTITSTNGAIYFDHCVFKMGTTSLNPIVFNAGNAGAIIWNNCQVGFSAVGQYLNVSNLFTWQNTGLVLASGSSVPTNLFSVSGSGNFSDIILEALDLSQIPSVFPTSATLGVMGNFVIKDCKLNSSATVANPIFPGNTLQYIRSDSGATAYKSARYALEGTETTETSITRVGGASDPTGQAQSRKIVTTANSQWLRPFKAEPYAIWNPVTGANVTVTVCGTVNAGALPNNGDIWIEVEYLGSSSYPLGTIVNTTKANLLAANAAVASDSSTWNGGGSGAGWSPFKLVAALSSPQPGMAGYIHVRVRVAKPSSTFWIDPQIGLS